VRRHAESRKAESKPRSIENNRMRVRLFFIPIVDGRTFLRYIEVMNFAETPQPNLEEYRKPQEAKSADQLQEVVPVAPIPNAANLTEADVALQEQTDVRKLAGLREQLGIQPETVNESLEQKKERLDNLWVNYERIQNDPELMALFSRNQQYDFKREAGEILREHGYPERTRISELQLETWKVNLNPKFIKNGYIYVLRGDHPNLDEKGFYARTYGYGKLTTEQLAEQLHGADEAGYALYGDERYLTTAKPSSNNTVEQLAYLQSAKGGSSFVSTTTSIPCAEAGTGNVPDAAEQLQYEVYVLKIPVNAAINSNTANHFGMEEDEVLVPDYISKDEIAAKFPRGKTEEVYQYLHDILGVTKEDLRIQE
jgi:hypothetical protein